MLKVYLVEDEVVVREGIRDKVAWKANGFEFAGEASDGELAFPMIRQIQPEIVITDIKMPFMDGLTLSRQVRQILPWTKIILLSGYDDFQYAQEAINIGVTEYLLKPIASAKLMETLLKVKQVILEEQSQKQLQEQYKRDMRENVDFHWSRFFNQLVSRRLTNPEILAKAAELEISLTAKSYNVLLFSCGLRKGAGKEEYSEKLVQMENRIEQTFADTEKTLLFKRGLEGWAILVKGSEQEPAAALTNRCVVELEKLFYADSSIGFFIGVGMPVLRLRQIPKSFDEASRAFAYRYLLETNRTVFYNKVPKPDKPAAMGLSLNSLESIKNDRITIDRFLNSGLTDNVPLFVDEYIENLGGEHSDSLLFRQYIVISFSVAAAAFLDEIGVGRQSLIDQCGDLDEITQNLNSGDSMKQVILKILQASIDLRDRSSKQRYVSLVARARSYIQEYYASESISLNQVAQIVNISPAYFSSIFSQENGVTFIEYLTNMRLTRAKELLRSTNMRSSEISAAVGYKDPHYFSYLFKKMTGYTPKDYRSGKFEN